MDVNLKSLPMRWRKSLPLCAICSFIFVARYVKRDGERSNLRMKQLWGFKQNISKEIKEEIKNMVRD
jgi:hypothetical protein